MPRLVLVAGSLSTVDVTRLPNGSYSAWNCSLVNDSGRSTTYTFSGSVPSGATGSSSTNPTAPLASLEDAPAPAEAHGLRTLDGYGE